MHIIPKTKIPNIHNFTPFNKFVARLQPLHLPYACSSRNVTADFVQNPVPLRQSLLPYEHSSKNVTGESVQNQVPQLPLFPGNASRPSMKEISKRGR